MGNIFAHDHMNDLLEALEITAFDARSMFKLLDRDGSGNIDIEEFCDGCLRLKGEAKSFDIQCLIYESQRLITKTTALMGHLEESITDLKDVMHASTVSVNKNVRKSIVNAAMFATTGRPVEERTSFSPMSTLTS